MVNHLRDNVHHLRGDGDVRLLMALRDRDADSQDVSDLLGHDLHSVPYHNGHHEI